MVKTVSMLFGIIFVLIGVLDANITYHITVKGLALGTVEAAAHAYRGLLERESCRVLGERKHFSKGNVSLVFRAPYRVERDGLDHILATEIPADLRGAVDWETALAAYDGDSGKAFATLLGPRATADETPATVPDVAAMIRLPSPLFSQERLSGGASAVALPPRGFT